MKYTTAEKINLSTISQIISNGWELEASRDIDGAIENFKPIWSNVDEIPDFSAFDLNHQATLYRLSGFFLSIFGSIRGVKLYQERAKDLLCQAIELFTELNDKYGIADTQNVLAVCYYNEGSILEAEAILEQTVNDFLDNYLHPVYLRNRNNLLQVTLRKADYQTSLKIIEEIRIPMEFCEDFRTCALFHEKAGLAYRRVLQYETAIWHYNESIKFAYKINNLLFVCTERNNLAFLYNKLKNFELAHYNINEALRLTREHNFPGCLPIYLDTQALIYANEGCHELALEIIDEAISVYKQGDDYFGLTESIWNKCKFLLHLDRKEEAILLFTELIPIAAQQMGDFAVKQFTKEFSNLIHIKQDGSLDDEVKRFKRVEIVNAIRSANYDLNKAANFLKIDTTSLAKILDCEFPELYDELDIQHFAKLKEISEKANEKPNYSAPRKISQLNLQNVTYKFETEIPQEVSTFYASSEKMSEVFGVSFDVVMAIIPAKEFSAGDFLLVNNSANHTYSFGKVDYDKDLDLYFLNDKDMPMPLSLNQVELIGKVIAYCNFEEIDNDELHFKPLIF